ncbi:MAG TPA: SMP-30/gluconolactonase/LRE family protein [Longimicrobium sp.]|nr:SMP-30/gluconolactonase/LRE family protein [Longimicrobium sp.]
MASLATRARGQRSAVPRAVLRARARLGEGPAWDPEAGELWWVDVWDFRVNRWDPVTGKNETFDVGEPAAFAVPARGGTVIVGLRQRVVRLDPRTGAHTMVAHVPGLAPDERLNDGKCDPRGRLWFGTTARDEGTASLFCLDASGAWRVDGGFTIANGLGWSPDEATFYVADSPARRIHAYDFDAGSGEISGRRVFAATHGAAFPDGAAVDTEGCVWSAQWDGGCVIRFAPDGRELERVTFPVPLTTSCCFGGADGRDLYVTSAQVGLDDRRLEAAWNSGDLFVVRVGVRGMPVAPFAG